MTKREAAIVSAHTGILIGKFDDMNDYVQELVGYPVFTHQYAVQTFMDKVRFLSKEDFEKIKIEDGDEE